MPLQSSPSSRTRSKTSPTLPDSEEEQKSGGNVPGDGGDPVAGDNGDDDDDGSSGNGGDKKDGGGTDEDDDDGGGGNDDGGDDGGDDDDDDEESDNNSDEDDKKLPARDTSDKDEELSDDVPKYISLTEFIESKMPSERLFTLGDISEDSDEQSEEVVSISSDDERFEGQTRDYRRAFRDLCQKRRDLGVAKK